MARIVERLMIAGEPALVSFNGGTKDNAINRECKAELVYAEMCIRDSSSPTKECEREGRVALAFLFSVRGFEPRSGRGAGGFEPRSGRGAEET